ncbi:MAG: hypothetical protein IKI59_00210 [Clostridia bacterium]|nr:hypothetical protein [Clostridia bacterium]
MRTPPSPWNKPHCRRTSLFHYWHHCRHLLLIINRVVLWPQSGTTVKPTQRLYRRFRYDVLAFK